MVEILFAASDHLSVYKLSFKKIPQQAPLNLYYWSVAISFYWNEDQKPL